MKRNVAALAAFAAVAAMGTSSGALVQAPRSEPAPAPPGERYTPGRKQRRMSDGRYHKWGTQSPKDAREKALERRKAQKAARKKQRR